MFRLFAWTFCLFVFSVQGTERDVVPHRLFAPMERSSFLPQIPKVNLATGEYCEETCDLVVAGSEPISIRRFYNHSSGQFEQIYGHWRVNPETFMLFNFEPAQKTDTYVGAGGANGNFVLFDNRIASGFTLQLIKNKGFANSSLSGQYHPLNTRISYKKGTTTVNFGICEPEKHCWWEGSIKEGDGSERFFKTDTRQWPQMGNETPQRIRRHPCSGEIEIQEFPFKPPYQGQIIKERKPNGNVICYEYLDCNAKNPYVWHVLPTSYALKSIKAYSATGVALGSIEIEYADHSFSGLRAYFQLIDKVTFKGSDGRTAVYGQTQRTVHQSVEYDTVLEQVISPGKPLQRYAYQNFRNKKNNGYVRPPLLCRVQQGTGSFYETTYKEDKKVAAQSAPVGPNGKVVPIARYEYGGNYTIVYDAEDNKTLYRFDQDKRIIAVERYKANTLYSVERSRWEPSTGNLLKKWVEDAAGNLFYSAEYKYDANHNAIEERVLGASPIYRKFSADGLNLKLTESDRPGKEIRYSYVPHTNLLASELVTLHGKIVKRTFHFYDRALGAVCIKTIIDDGKSANPEDLSDVTFRKIIEVSPKRTLPCIGLPEEVREYAGEKMLKKVRYTYHPSGKIASEVHYDADNHYCYTLRNRYNDQELLVETTDALGYSTRFSYDSQFNLTAQEGPRPDQRIEWRYDLANRPVQQLEWQSDGTILVTEQVYDKNSRVIAAIDPSGFKTCYSYDQLGRLIEITHPDGAVEKKAYNILDQIIEETDPNGGTVRREYNPRGQATAIFYPDGTQERFVYNKEGGTLAEHTDRHGVTIFYTYDLLDNLIQTKTETATTTAAYTPFRLISETDPLGAATTITYDLAGRKIAERKGEKETRLAYDSLGRLCRTEEGDVITHLTHDFKGRLLEKTIEDAFRESYLYDEAGNRSAVTTCGGTTYTAYNTRGEPIRIEDPLGRVTEISYSYEGGLCKTTRDPKGIVRTIFHDAHKRPIDFQTHDSNGALIQREERAYDPAGNQTHATVSIFEGSELKKTLVHEWRYGPQGRLESFIEAGEKETRYFYDQLGRLASQIKPDGQSIHREYDSQNRLARYYGEGIDYSYTYDAKNRLIAIQDSIHNTTLECAYDLYDNMISETFDTGIEMKRDYDPYGRCTALHLPDKSTITRTYKGPFLHALSRGGLTHTYSMRNMSGRPTKILLANQQRVEIEWDPLHRWKSYFTPYFSAAYAYDEVGNLISYSYNDSEGEELARYQYDPLNQLITENERLYRYDSLYNRMSKDEADYTLNSFHQVTHDGNREYQYDLNGNLLSDGQRQYEYDLLDRLIAVTEKGKRTVYAYDALNRRIAKNKELYLWDGQHEIGMMRQGKIRELRVLGEGKGAEIGAAVLIELAGTPYIPIHDHRGSLVNLLTVKGGLAGTYRYTAFGETNDRKRLSPWGFASKRYDPETGFLYFGKRYYNPALGRWITPDPRGLQDSLNLYAYVFNNPLLYCDPYGLLARSYSEVHNPIDFCGWMWHCAFSAVEWIGHNMLPSIVPHEWFEGSCRFARGESFRKPKEEMEIITRGERRLEHVTKVYMNGILNNKNSAIADLEKLSEIHKGIEVVLLFNPSRGLVDDLLTSLILKCGIKTAYEKMCADFFKNGLNEDPLHQFDVTAHSQGCTRLNNVGDLLSREQRYRMDVSAYGSATIISKERFRDVNNYVSRLDGVPMTSTWSYVKNVAGFDSNVTFLSPHSKNPLTEHYLSGDTYWKQIELNGNDFIKKYVGN